MIFKKLKKQWITKMKPFKKWVLLLATFSKNSLSKVSAWFRDGEGHLQGGGGWQHDIATGPGPLVPCTSWPCHLGRWLSSPGLIPTKYSGGSSQTHRTSQEEKLGEGYLTITPRVSATIHFARIQILKGCRLAPGPVFRGSETGRPGDPATATDSSLGMPSAIRSEVHEHKTLEGWKDN